MRSNINTIFDLENDIGLLSFKTEDDIPIYLMAKYYLLRDVVMCKMLDLKTSANDRKINIAAFRFIRKAMLHNISHHDAFKGKEVIFYSVCRPTIINGKFFNRYTDYYADLLKDKSGTIEQTAMNWSWPFPRYFECVLFDGMETIKEKIVGNIKYKNELPVVKEFIVYFNKRLKNICGFRLTEEECAIAEKKIALNIFSMREKTKWLDRIIPEETKLVISVGGCYPHFFPINRMLKNRNILSADLQHGFITSTNLMYNYAPVLAGSDIVKEGSSDFFLTYGEWWNSQINGPSKKISIGNPYRDSCISKINTKNKEKRILLIGCEINTESYIKLTMELSEKLPDYKTVFRPHPGEINNTLQILQEKNYKIQMDDITEIYESLEKTSIVISEVSTVLFEAIGITDEIIVMNTEYSRSYLPIHPFKTCDSAEDVVNFVKGNMQGSTYDNNLIWNDNWEQKFLDFISDIGI